MLAVRLSMQLKKDVVMEENAKHDVEHERDQLKSQVTDRTSSMIVVVVGVVVVVVLILVEVVSVAVEITKLSANVISSRRR